MRLNLMVVGLAMAACSGGGNGDACPADSQDALASARQQCVQTINGFRATLGLPELKRWCAVTACSDSEAQRDAESQVAHSAFGACHESAQNECPGWPNPPLSNIDKCLQMMWAEGPGADYAQHGHFINMSNPNYTLVECGFSINDQNFWSVQNFQ